MQIIENIVPESKLALKCPYKMTPTRFVVHNTANYATARNEVAYMINNNNEVSFHYAIDDKEIVQGIWENRNSWQAGDGGSGKGNREGISIEICYSKSGGEKFVKAEQLTAKFIAYKLKQFGWGIDKVTKHQDYSGKYCPHRTLDLGWQRFLDMITANLSDLNSEPSASTTNELRRRIEALNEELEAYKSNIRDLQSSIVAKNEIVASLSKELDQYKHIEVEQTKTINELNAILIKQTQEKTALQDKLHLAELQVANMPKQIFNAPFSGRYFIRLDKNDVLYIKED